MRPRVRRVVVVDRRRALAASSAKGPRRVAFCRDRTKRSAVPSRGWGRRSDRAARDGVLVAEERCLMADRRRLDGGVRRGRARLSLSTTYGKSWPIQSNRAQATRGYVSYPGSAL